MQRPPLRVSLCQPVVTGRGRRRLPDRGGPLAAPEDDRVAPLLRLIMGELYNYAGLFALWGYLCAIPRLCGETRATGSRGRADHLEDPAEFGVVGAVAGPHDRLGGGDVEAPVA